MELDRQATLEAHTARIQAQLPEAIKEEKAEVKAQRHNWGVLGWLKNGSGRRSGQNLVKRLDMVNRMARNPGWSL